MSVTPTTFYIADHLALDFLNTSYGKLNPVELLTDDSNVYLWMKNAGINVENFPVKLLQANGELLRYALDLRNIAHDILRSAMNEIPLDLNKLNAYLTSGNYYHQLEQLDMPRLQLVRHNRYISTKDLLCPIAEAIADLIVNSNISLIKKCENPDCTLWFYDKTKSHQRRWCDMAICGNRMKAAAFRARAKQKP